MLLNIKNYTVGLKDSQKILLDNANMELKSGNVYVLTGENGSGKSSFAMSLIGINEYERKGSVKLNGVETIGMEIDEIARLGLMTTFQMPPEIDGVTLFDLIKTSYIAINGTEKLSSFKLRKRIIEFADKVGLNESFLQRSVNQGFSGGERRKAELLQILVIEPKLAILDEIDSGMDIKSQQKSIELIKQFVLSTDSSVLVISHNSEFIEKIKPSYIFELRKGKFE